MLTCHRLNKLLSTCSLVFIYVSLSIIQGRWTGSHLFWHACIQAFYTISVCAPVPNICIQWYIFDKNSIIIEYLDLKCHEYINNRYLHAMLYFYLKFLTLIKVMEIWITSNEQGNLCYSIHDQQNQYTCIHIQEDALISNIMNISWNFFIFQPEIICKHAE